MYVRDYAPLDKSPRDYSRGAAIWPLAVRRDTVVAPGAPQRVELDLAVKIESALAVQVIARPSLALEHGLRPTLGVEVRTSADRLAPLSLWVESLSEPVTLPAGTVIADMLLVSIDGQRLVPDPDLDHEMYEPGSGLSFDSSDEGRTRSAPEGFGG